MLGDILRKERERQNLTVKDIERDTSIRGLYLSAIENGEYDLLPGEVYLKGFIRSYAEYLKLDGAALLQQYYAEKGPIEAPVNPVGNSEAVKAASVETPAGAKTEFRERVEKSRQTQKILIGLAAAGLVFGGIYMGLRSDSEKPAATAPAATQAPAVHKETAPAVAVPEKKVDGVEVTATFSDKCWTKIIADEKTVFEGTVESGEKLTWKAKQQIVVTAGNAGAVDVVYNGKSLGKLGATGDVVTKKITQDKAENAD